MSKVEEFAVRHPAVVGLVFVASAAFTAWNAYKGGLRMQQLREFHGASARAASEALGG